MASANTVDTNIRTLAHEIYEAREEGSRILRHTITLPHGWLTTTPRFASTNITASNGDSSSREHLLGGITVGELVDLDLGLGLLGGRLALLRGRLVGLGLLDLLLLRRRLLLLLLGRRLLLLRLGLLGLLGLLNLLLLGGGLLFGGGLLLDGLVSLVDLCLFGRLGLVGVFSVDVFGDSLGLLGLAATLDSDVDGDLETRSAPVQRGSIPASRMDLTYHDIGLVVASRDARVLGSVPTVATEIQGSTNNV